MPRRSYAGAAQPTALTGDFTAIATSFTVTNGAGYPDGVTGPFFLVLARDKANEEKVLATARAGNVFTVPLANRGQDGTAIQTHPSGTSVEHVFTATDADEANAHINATVGAHPATAISYTPSGTLSATTVQEALTELGVEKSATGHTHAAGAVAASAVTYAGSAGLSAANVEAALDELDTEKLGKTGGETITASGAAVKGLVVKAATSATANLFEAQNSAGTALVVIAAAGRVTARMGVTAEAGSAASSPLVLTGAADQTAHLLEIERSDGVQIAGFDAGGALMQTGTPRLEGMTVTGNAGAQIGYFSILIGVTTFKVPLYNA